MKKKHFIIIILCFAILIPIEAGIYEEIIWHGWGGFGDVTLEYNKAGLIGISVLLLFIPLCVLIALFRRIALCLKERSGGKKLLIDCLCAFLGIGIGLGYFSLWYFFLWYLLPGNLGILDPFFLFGRGIAAFFIELFDWMDVPMP